MFDTRAYVATEEPYQCERDCQSHDGETWLANNRSARACGLPWLPAVPPRPTVKALLEPSKADPYMGRPGSRKLNSLVQLGRAERPDRPREDVEDGCPGAWYRTAFVDSIDRFTRRRTEGGGRVSNPAFDGAGEQMQAAVMHFEHEQERAICHRNEVQYERDAAEQRRRERANATSPTGVRRRGWG